MDKIILYGAGTVGRKIYDFLQFQGILTLLYAYCDKNVKSKQLKGIPVLSYQDAKDAKLPFVIAVEKNSNAYQEISNQLKQDEMEFYEDITQYQMIKLGYDRVKINRDYCAYFHFSNMESYFQDAEKQNEVSIFWGEDSIFLSMFNQLDLSNVIELACGRGRHVSFYIDKANHITLVDILQKNISYCKNRFSDYNHIYYIQNNGKDLAQLPSCNYTSLFSYDAMVHFELLDIYSYLRETYRVLCSGGRALFHHSNIDNDYKNSFRNCSNPGGRSFMSKKLFAHLAYSTGFEIMDQHIIDWSAPEMDCITLVQKPNCS